MSYWLLRPFLLRKILFRAIVCHGFVMLRFCANVTVTDIRIHRYVWQSRCNASWHSISCRYVNVRSQNLSLAVFPNYASHWSRAPVTFRTAAKSDRGFSRKLGNRYAFRTGIYLFLFLLLCKMIWSSHFVTWSSHILNEYLLTMNNVCKCKSETM